MSLLPLCRGAQVIGRNALDGEINSHLMEGAVQLERRSNTLAWTQMPHMVGTPFASKCPHHLFFLAPKCLPNS